MLLQIKNLTYVYNEDMPYETKAIKNISIEIPENSFIGLIGHTGSGKSTLVQHMNGLIKASSGEILFNGENIYSDKFNLKNLRKHVGLVFQYPEHQLFEETVFKDVAFGPKNQGLSEEEIKSRVENALKLVNISEDKWEESPIGMSGGQKRRVAIAGVLAMQPKILILDEPTAGLDPKGRNEILKEIKKIHTQEKITVIMVSHSMEEIAEYVDKIIVMNDGSVVYNDTPKNIFKKYKELEKIGLAAPKMTYLMNDLKSAGFDVNTEITKMDDAVIEIEKLIKQ